MDKKRNCLALALFLIIMQLSNANVSASVKEADKAGTWYPSDQKVLSGMLSGYLLGAKYKPINGKIIAIVSPHAGYAASGPVAAYGFKALLEKNIKLAVIVGFNHRFRHDGIAVSDYEGFKSPLGEVKISKDVTEQLINENEKIYALKDAFQDEQSIEMQIPFLQMVLGDFSVVMISIGDQTSENIDILSEALYNVLKDRSDYVLVASTDMCHYLPYAKNNAVDNYTISVIKEFDSTKLLESSVKNNHKLMCGYGAVCAVMSASKKLGADNVRILKHANSGDMFGDRSKVVGYLSAVFLDSDTRENKEKKVIDNSIKETVDNMLSENERKEILELARRSIIHYLKTGNKLEVESMGGVLQDEMGAFVTLHKNGRLRGCIGNMIGKGPFYLTVRDMAVSSAVSDPRFRPVTLGEMKDIDIEVSALSTLRKIKDPGIIEVGKHGVLVQQGGRSGVYLPQVATETGWDREQFMNSLCGDKAGLDPDAWKNGKCDIFIFTAEVFGETKN